MNCNNIITTTLVGSVVVIISIDRIGSKPERETDREGTVL